MTKCERIYEVIQPLDEAALAAVNRLHGMYGIQKLRVSPSLDTLTVGWDAARLTQAQVESILAQNGLAVRLRTYTTA
jgi:hypothetical protein